MKSSMFTNNNDDDDDVNIFMSSSKVTNNLLPNNTLGPKIGSSNQPSNSVYTSNNNASGKLNDAKRILDEAGQKMKDKPMSYGLTSQIGLLNMNSSIGKTSLLGQAIKFDSLAPVSENNQDKPKNFEVKKDHKTSINPKVAISKAIKADEIQEVDCDISDNKQENEITKKNSNDTYPIPKNIEPTPIQQTENQEALMKKTQASSIVSISKSNEVEESNPRMKLYNLILGKETIDPAALKSFLYT